MTSNNVRHHGLSRSTRERHRKSFWRKNFLPAALGALLLIIGAGIGAGAAILYMRHKLAPELCHTERVGTMLTASITGDVTLTADETTKITTLVQQNVGAMDRLSSEYGQSIQGVFDGMCLEICEILGPQRSHAWQDAMRRSFGKRAAERIAGWHHTTGDDCAASAIVLPAKTLENNE